MKPALCLLVASLMTSNVHAAPALTPPDAEKQPHTVKAPFGATRTDDYYWLRDDKREDAKMLAYLNAENAYTDQVVAPLKPLEDTLYKEIVARIKQDDASVPSRDRGYWYYTRFETGKDYPIQARRKGSMEAPEEILLDLNTMAEGKGYFDVGDADVSQDNHLLAWAEDDVGRRQYVIRFKDLRTGEVLPDWNVSAGYTYTQSKYIGGEQKGEDFNGASPRHLFKVATDYRLPGTLNPLRVGGSFYAQSEMAQTEVGKDYRIRQDAYHLTNLHAIYEINRNLELQYNLDNVFDKKYYQTLGNTNYWNFYGEPRNFNVALRAKF
mgnify:CR=1 FL=1